MAKSGLADRLYRGEANLNVVGRSRMWFTIAAALVLLAIGSFVIRGFHLGIEFAGGTQIIMPVSVGSQTDAQNAVTEALSAAGVEDTQVGAAQQVGNGPDATYSVRTESLTQPQADAVKAELARDIGVPADNISDNRVSAAWGDQVTRQALIGLGIFLVLVMIYLIIRFEWRMAVAAVASLLIDLVLTAGVYSVVGFEVTPSTVIGFLTILGFALYDVVVVFDKVQENTKDITASTTRTYGEAANLAVNQVMMRSINTSVVALLPVGGLLFIGAGVLGAGTLKDLGLVLFVGMAVSFYSSLFFSAPLLVELKSRERRYHAHTQRVLAKRAAQAQREAQKQSRRAEESQPARTAPSAAALTIDPSLVDLAGAAPKVGARPAQSRRSGRKRSGGGKRR